MDNGESLKRAPDGMESAEGPGSSLKNIVRVIVKFFRKLLLVGVTAALLLFIFAMATINMPPFNLQKLEKFKPGMSKKEVTKTLGRPTHDWKDQWTYARWGWPMVHIYFDADERFESSEYDY